MGLFSNTTLTNVTRAPEPTLGPVPQAPSIQPISDLLSPLEDELKSLRASSSAALTNKPRAVLNKRSRNPLNALSLLDDEAQMLGS